MTTENIFTNQTHPYLFKILYAKTGGFYGGPFNKWPTGGPLAKKSLKRR